MENLDVQDLPWYHPNLTRHQAEALLIQNASDGSYLLRDSTTTGPSEIRYSLSCRCSNAVKHYQITWDGSEYSFGMGKFQTLADFVKHFENKPLIGGQSGVLTLLKVAYPRDIEEPEEYEVVHVHAEWGKQKSQDKNNTIPSSINSKEGFLIKQGGVVKNWKNRWFVLHKNELRYYKARGEALPIRTLDLEKCIDILDDSGTGKPFSFGVVMPGRTFFLVAQSDCEKEEWLSVLKWKMEQVRR